MSEWRTLEELAASNSLPMKAVASSGETVTVHFRTGNAFHGEDGVGYYVQRNSNTRSWKLWKKPSTYEDRWLWVHKERGVVNSVGYLSYDPDPAGQMWEKLEWSKHSFSVDEDES